MRKALLVFGAALLLVGMVYRHAPPNFLRSESGWYLRTAYSSAETQRNFERDFFHLSYSGHYTPLVFLAEFRAARLIGTNGAVWLGRQIFALALLAAATFALAQRLGSIFELSRGSQVAFATAVAAVSAFQLPMLDLITWPFMILQLVWVGVALLVLYALVMVSREPEKARWVWVSALAAYASLHVSGLGLALVAAVTAALSGIIVVARCSPQSNLAIVRSSAPAALGTMLALTLLHGWAMVHFLPPNFHSIDRSAEIIPLIKLLLGFLANFTLAGAGTFAATAFPVFNGNSVASCWPYGLLLLALPIVLWGRMLRRTIVDPTPQKLSGLILHAYSIAGAWTLVGLVASRELLLRSVAEMLPQLGHYLSVPRYLVPLHFVLLASALHLAVVLSRKAPRVSTGVWCGVAVAAVLAQLEFQSSAYKFVAPRPSISHTKAWKEILEVVRDCRARNLPVPDMPTTTLTQEFSSNLSAFDPVLRHDLKIENGEIKFIPWEEFLSGDVQRYQEVPRLEQLRRLLQLDKK